jgi:hypothetical protein
MTIYEKLSIFLSASALFVSIYTLYVSRKKGRVRIRFDIRMYQIQIDIVNVGETPLVVTDIRIIAVINDMPYFGISPKIPPVLPAKVDRWGVIRLEDFSQSIADALKNSFSNYDALNAKVSVYVETSQGDVYYRVNDQLIDLFKSVELARKYKNK